MAAMKFSQHIPMARFVQIMRNSPNFTQTICKSEKLQRMISSVIEAIMEANFSTAGTRLHHVISFILRLEA
jgi:hypothetical protein